MGEVVTIPEIQPAAKRRWKVLYRARPSWVIGEKQEDRDARVRDEHAPAESPADCYPGDWNGFVVSIINASRDYSPADLADPNRRVVELDLTDEERAGLASQRSRLVAGRVEAVDFDVRWGRIAPVLHANFDDAEAAEREAETPPADPVELAAFYGSDAWRFGELVALNRQMLPKTECHTGAGLYRVRGLDTINDTVTVGAYDAGNDRTTLTSAGSYAADYLVGLFCVFTTSFNRYSIVGNTGTTIYVHGDATGEASPDAVLIGPLSTIQSAFDQLWTDQGAATFTAKQTVRVFAGTYDENVIANSGLNPDDTSGYLLILEGDPSDSRANVIIAPSGGTYAVSLDVDVFLLRHLTVQGTPGTAMVYAHANNLLGEVNDCVVSGAKTLIQITRPSRVIGCALNPTGCLAVGMGEHYVERCIITGQGGTTYGVSGGNLTVLDTVFSGLTASGISMGANGRSAKTDIRSCTFYNCAEAITFYEDFQHVILIDNIFKDCTLNFDAARVLWPEEDSTHIGSRWTLRSNCFHGYTTFASVNVGADTKTFAEFAALDRVDASGDLDATDPLLTNPAAGDFSLQAASPCKWAGHGSGVTTDYLGTAFDAYHPDIGAWSSGTLTVSAPGLALTDDGNGTSFTAAVTAYHAQCVTTVYYARSTGGAMTPFATTITGTGSTHVTGLVPGRYYACARSVFRGQTSAVSDVLKVIISDGTTCDVVTAFRGLLVQNAGVAALVGDRVYAHEAPQRVSTSASEYIVYRRATGDHARAVGGALGEARASIEIECRGATYADVLALAEAVRLAVDGYTGTVSTDMGSLAIECGFQSEVDAYEEPFDGSERGRIAVVHEYYVRHAETVPTF